jgi:alpha-glucosidase
MPWRNQPLGDFTTGTPWLPLSPANLARAVETEADDPESLLNLTRSLLDLRKAHQALRLGALTDCGTEGPLLEFTRSAGDERIICRFNLGRDNVQLKAAEKGKVLLDINGATPATMPGYSALYLFVS